MDVEVFTKWISVLFAWLALSLTSSNALAHYWQGHINIQFNDLLTYKQASELIYSYGLSIVSDERYPGNPAN